MGHQGCCRAGPRDGRAGGGLQGGQPALRALSLCVPEEGKIWEGRIWPASTLPRLSLGLPAKELPKEGRREPGMGPGMSVLAKRW